MGSPDQLDVGEVFNYLPLLCERPAPLLRPGILRSSQGRDRMRRRRVIVKSMMNKQLAETILEQISVNNLGLA